MSEVHSRLKDLLRDLPNGTVIFLRIQCLQKFQDREGGRKDWATLTRASPSNPVVCKDHHEPSIKFSFEPFLDQSEPKKLIGESFNTLRPIFEAKVLHGNPSDDGFGW